MRASVLAIGDELLSGKTTNTNATWISQKLMVVGCDVVRHLVVSDDEIEIIDSLNTLFNYKIDLIICTGGLGPTNDDITRNAIFNFFNSDSHFDNDYWEYIQNKFLSIGYKIPKSNKSQAIIPSNGKVFSNPTGSARGLLFEKNNITLMALPGVPSEMQLMIKETVIPWVSKKSKKQNYSINIRTTGVPESVLFEKINNYNNLDKIKIGYYPSLLGVDIRINGSNKKSIKLFEKMIISNVSEYIYTIGEESLEELVVKKMLNNNITISTAESCTGGLIGHRITQVPGSSSIYQGGVVSYSNKSKLAQLNINSNTLKKYGAVSKEVALEMAVNVRTIFDSNIGLSVTGISGPGGGSIDKPVGLVYVAYCDHNISKVEKFNFHSNRESNKFRTSQSALHLILKNLLKNEK